MPVDLRLTAIRVICSNDPESKIKVKAYYKELHSQEPIQTEEKKVILSSLKMKHDEALTEE